MTNNPQPPDDHWEEAVQEEQQDTIQAANKSTLVLWREVANEVLADIAQGREIYRFVVTNGITQHDFPQGRWRRFFMALAETYRQLPEAEELAVAEILPNWMEGTVINPEEYVWLSKFFDGTAISRTANLRKRLLDDLRSARLEAQVDRVISGALKHRRTGQMTAIEIQSWITQEMSRVNTVRAQTTEDVTGLQLANYVRTDVKLEKGVVETPFVALNYYTEGGLIPGNLSVIAGAPKAQKTRAAVACIIYALEQGRRVFYYTLEERREVFIKRIACILAGMYIRLTQTGPFTKDNEGRPFDEITPANWLSQAGLKKLQHPVRQEAIDFARQRIQQYGNRLIVRDSSRDGGQVDILQNAVTQYMFDCDIYGPPDLWVFDHTHQVRDKRIGGEHSVANMDYVRLSVVGTALHPLVLDTRAVGLLMAQRTSESAKKITPGKNSSGIRGGEKLTEVATISLIVQGGWDDGTQNSNGRQVYHSDKLFYSLRSNRFHLMPSELQEAKIHAPTGWIGGDIPLLRSSRRKQEAQAGEVLL